MIIEVFIKKILDNLVKERFDEVKELTDEIDYNDLIYYFKNNNNNRNFNDFDNGIELFKNMQSGEMKLEDPKKQQNYLNKF